MPSNVWSRSNIFIRHFALQLFDRLATACPRSNQSETVTLVILLAVKCKSVFRAHFVTNTMLNENGWSFSRGITKFNRCMGLNPLKVVIINNCAEQWYEPWFHRKKIRRILFGSLILSLNFQKPQQACSLARISLFYYLFLIQALIKVVWLWRDRV